MPPPTGRARGQRPVVRGIGDWQTVIALCVPNPPGGAKEIHAACFYRGFGNLHVENASGKFCNSFPNADCKFYKRGRYSSRVKLAVMAANTGSTTDSSWSSVWLSTTYVSPACQNARTLAVLSRST